MSENVIVGIPAGIASIKGTPRYYVNEADINGIIKAGGTPLMIPSQAIGSLDYYLSVCDGFFFTGGPDVLPAFYGEEPHVKMGFSDIKRDRLELALVKRALVAGKKMLGICRGMQVINIALGGTVYQDLESEYGNQTEHLIKHFQAAPTAEPTHYVEFESGTRLNRLYGSRQLVNSRHHQAVRNIAAGLKAAAFAKDGVMEGLESKDSDQILAVQWHPEMLAAADPKMQQFFDSFVGSLK
ncbi:gamma-glutamyl-gamma-aminobutyrate hydrolase family protein [Liquorilactobacillus oeni]|uniref:Peptidase C26 n=1 Tax=Liquorilactobacillus oeni DSM 19972 TaxID=1423777 RepID=A0A0R1MJA5_9LACO|nr:gamma-glutamyl-gamma-aminobutyrate hydrolase family protein [Liquorilactobacillus oeni]KRL05346.1 peptidase C26 [Liquorilactobacillus oeni DSM 19972]